MFVDSAILIVAVCVVVFVAWNIIPALREKLRGFSTVLESAGVFMLYQAGILTEALNELVGAGMLPADYKQYTPFIMFAYLVIKRWQTTSPIGKHDPSKYDPS